MIETSSYVTSWLDYLAVSLRRSPRTLEEYSKDMRALVEWSRPYGSPLSILHLSPGILEAYFSSVAASSLSASTMKRRVSSVRSFFQWACLHGLCEKDPTAYIKTPKIPARNPDVASLACVRDFLDELPSSPARRQLHFIVAIMLATGMRLSEVLSLRAEDFDFEQGVVSVIGKGNKQRFCAFTPSSAVVLSEFVGASTGPLFPGVKESTARWSIIKATNQNGRGIHPHAIRHLYASMCVANGMPLFDLSRQLGHASVKTTERYLHLDVSSLRASIDRYAPTL